MRRGVVTLVVTFVIALAGSLEAQSLRGSSASLAKQNRQVEAHNFSYLKSRHEVERFVRDGLLVPIEGNEDYQWAKVSFPYARPAVKVFLERLGREYRAVCGEPLVVTSLVRPISHQPRNASDRSVHPTGMAVDLRRNNEPKCRSWLESTLLRLEAQGVLEATHEKRPPHYHIALFPKPYTQYLASGVESDDKVAFYQVRRGDSLWTIARKHATTVDELKRVNGLKSSRVLAGQVLRIPVDDGRSVVSSIGRLPGPVARPFPGRGPSHDGKDPSRRHIGRRLRGAGVCPAAEPRARSHHARRS